ncbi:hypothetical protein FRB99_005091 [Tulasnella sp. 403]|nr:hypothetical protein FRB99_005091 [Tulasnella sp. 403]
MDTPNDSPSTHMPTTPNASGGDAEGASVGMMGVDEPPSSFPRVPLPEVVASTDGTNEDDTRTRSSKGKKVVKAGGGNNNVPRTRSELDPMDQEAVARANLAAAPFVGVVGYGPGTGGGSGIRRHTPSCDFCKRRKERCIGGPPCQTCANRDIPCTFQTVNKAHFERKRIRGSLPNTGENKAWSIHGSTSTLPPVVEAPVAGPSGSNLVAESTPPVERIPRVFKKRGKVSEIACNFCRDRRKKCSAERPTCSNCHRRGVECVYPETPRARRGGRKKKDGTAAGQEGAEGAAAPEPPNIAISAIGIPGMIMPLPFLSPAPCHFCRDQDIPCDRAIPMCTNCSRRSQACNYDPFTHDPAQLPWPGAPPPPMKDMVASTSLGPPQITNPSPAATQAALAAAGQGPYVDMSWMSHWADLQAQGHPLAAMYAIPLATLTGDGKGGPTLHPFVYSQLYDPAVTAAFAQVQAFSQGQQAQSAAAAIAQTEPVVERAGDADKATIDDATDIQAVISGPPVPEPHVEDADGEELDLDELDATGNDDA